MHYEYNKFLNYYYTFFLKYTFNLNLSFPLKLKKKIVTAEDMDQPIQNYSYLTVNLKFKILVYSFI